MRVIIITKSGREIIDCKGAVVCNNDSLPVAAAIDVPNNVMFYSACDDPRFVELLNMLGVKPANGYIPVSVSK